MAECNAHDEVVRFEGGSSSDGRTSAFQAEGRGFNSRLPLQPRSKLGKGARRPPAREPFGQDVEVAHRSERRARPETSRTGPAGAFSGCWTEVLSAELIGILSVGAALGGLVLALQSRTDKRLDGFEKRFGEELAGLRVARLEGLIECSGLFRPAQPSEMAGG